MSVSKFTQPNYATQGGSVYPTAIDDAVAVMKRFAAAFAAHESDPLAMTVEIDAGPLFAAGTLTEVAAQTTAAFVAPAADPRIDRIVIDATTGTVEVAQGAEAAAPVPPSIPAGKLPVCQVALTVGMTEITNADLTDERVGTGAGGGGLYPGTIEWLATKTPPAGRLKANGAAVSRSTYAALFEAVTFTDETLDTTDSSTTATMADTSEVEPGYDIEGPGIPAGTTVISIDSGTDITLSQAATATASNITARFLPHGGGDGATTFNVPDVRGEFIRGWDNGRGVDGGRAFGSAQGDAFEDHVHSLPLVTGGSGSSGFDLANLDDNVAYNPSQRNTSLAGPTSVSTASETRPRNVAFLACIVY